jgi:hypothetical protein
MTNGAATASTGMVQVFSGNVSAGNGTSGNLNVYSGSTNGSGFSGAVNVTSGVTNGSGTSGAFAAGSGTAFGSGNSGYTVLQSGNANTGSSGQLDLRTGNGGSASGFIQIITGTAFADNNTGQVTVSTGSATGIGASGFININSGNTVNGGSGNINIFNGYVSGTGQRGIVDVNTRAVQVQASEYISLNTGTANNANIILNHSSTNGQVIVQNGGNLGSGDLGISFKTRDESLYGRNIHASVFMTSYAGNKTHLGIIAGNDSPTAQAGDLLLAAGGAGTGANNGGNIYLESGYSLGGNGGSINLRINGPGTTVGKIGLDGVMKVSVRTGHTNLEDGDVWFDGTNLYMRIGGVTKTFTMV